MCACEATFTCPRCRGTRLDPAYLLDDPEPNDPRETDQDVRPAEYEVSER